MLKERYPEGRIRIFFTIIGNERGRKPSQRDAAKWDLLAKWNEYGMTLLDPEQIALEGMWDVIGKDASMILTPGFVNFHTYHHIFEAPEILDRALAQSP